MGADEVLARLAEQARAEQAEFINAGGVDLAGLVVAGKARLIKGMKETKYGTDIEFYDAQAALVHIGKNLGLFKDSKEIPEIKINVSLKDPDGNRS